jgi:hypothetical protein
MYLDMHLRSRYVLTAAYMLDAPSPMDLFSFLPELHRYKMASALRCR